ncbi:MAG: daptomycin-sensing surface protein LiaX [Enterococcus sp.]
MKERERILDLVKKGVLSTEEALDLLESMATKRDEKQIAKEADQVTSQKEQKDSVDQLLNELETPNAEDAEEIKDEIDAKQKEKEDQENLEKILDELATEANNTSAELDEINMELKQEKAKLTEKQEALMQLNTKEELGMTSEEDFTYRKELEQQIKDQENAVDKLKEKQIHHEAKLRNIRKDQWSEKKETISNKFDLPDDWKDQATDTLNQVGEKMSEAGSQLGKFLKKTFQTVNDNMEWKDVNLRVPGVATTKFEHEFYYENAQATIIDIKAANGNVELKTWDSEDIKVEAAIKLYGKMSGEPFEAFEERSQIEVDEESIVFHIPNKRVRADLVFYLPKRMYDHVAIKLLNGNILINELEAKDVYSKSTNGKIETRDLTATMLEIEGVNGDIDIHRGELLDSIIETVNGTVVVDTTPETVAISVVNGNIRATFTEDTLKKVDASSVNGNVKVALPQSLGVDGHAKTSLGSINTRMTEYEVIREKKERTNQMLQFHRAADAMATLQLTTTTGNIFLKDTEK